MKFNLSIFNSKGLNKVPQSPYNDKTFDFETIEVDFEELNFYFSNNYILNRNYCFEKTRRLRKIKTELSKYLCKTINYIILDIDKIFLEEDLNYIIKIFEESDYYIHLQKSRSFNGKTNFNLKGLILVTGKNDEEGIKEFLQQLQRLIGKRGEIDLSVSREATHQAPTIKNEVLLHKEGTELPEIKKINQSKKKTLIVDDHNVLMVCLNYLSTLGFNPVKEKDDMIIFRHPNEKTPKGYFLFKNNPFILHHFNPSKSINIFKNVIKNKEVKKYFKTLNKEKIKSILSFKEGKTKNSLFVNERFLKIDDKKEGLIKDFLSSKRGILKIKSPMGTGKSNLIEEVLKQTDKKVLFITNRISIAKDIKNKYKKFNLKIYNEDDYIIGDNLVCQFDSLWKYDLKYFDLIILDEFMSLLFHIRNNLNSHNILNKIKFFYALKKSHIVISDALFFGIENKFLRVTHKIINKYRENAEIILYENKYYLLSKELKNIKKEVKEKRKVTISCSSRITANAINEFLRSKGIKSIILDSKTSNSEREFIYETFNNEEGLYEVLIYTPTITVGINMTFKSNLHIHIDETNSIDVISSIQQIKRNRNSKRIALFIQEIERSLIFDEEILLNDFKKDLNFNNKKIDVGFLIDLDENGSFKPSKFAEFLFKIEALYNLLENNHKFSFLTLLKNQFKYKLKEVSGRAENFLAYYKNIFKEKENKKFEKYIIDDFKKETIKDELLRYFKELSDEDVKYLFTNLQKENNLLEKIKYLSIYRKRIFNDFYISKIDEKILTKEEKALLNFIKILENNNFNLKNRFTISELKKLNYPLEYLKKFLKFVGFKWKYNSYMLDDEILKLSEKILI